MTEQRPPALYSSRPTEPGQILARWKLLREHLALGEASGPDPNRDDGQVEWAANIEFVKGQLADVQAQIDDGQLTASETAEYLRIVDGDPFDDASDAGAARRESLMKRTISALRNSAGWVPMPQLVEEIQGRQLTESSAQHAAVRKVLARMVWPTEYGLPGPPTADVILSAGSVFSAARWIGDR